MPQTNTFSAAVAFCQAVRLLVRRLRKVRSGPALSWPEMSVMGLLARGGPATTAALAREEGMKPQSMRTIVATLDAKGFISRAPHPTDGRQVYIALTAKGAAARKAVKDERSRWLIDSIAKLSGEERKTLFAASAVIKRLGEM
jgi:DNA-binding MarR family transcriptional regulator